MQGRTGETERPDASARHSSTSRARWCGATWLLLVTGVIWSMFVLVHPVLGDSPWRAGVDALLRPAGYVIVPVVLLLAVSAVRRFRAAVPVVPRRIIVALALIDLLFGVLEVESSIG
jgi:hypothetical protein